MKEIYEEIKTYVLYIKKRGRIKEDIEIEVEAKDQTHALKILLANYPQLENYSKDFLLNNLGVIIS